jgi:ubiquinone/menaquinone biosynthesis C-methylase UbiE
MGDEHEWSKLRSTVFSFIYRNPKSNRLLVRRADLEPDDQVLDIGCGPGAAVRAAATVVSAGRAAGVDRSRAMVDIARRRAADLPNVAFEVGVAESLPFPDGAFTVVWTAHAFHHWSDQESGLKEAYRVLAPGGRLFIVENTSTGEHGITLERAMDLEAKLGDLGFTRTFLDRLGKDYLVGARVPGAAPATR